MKGRLCNSQIGFTRRRFLIVLVAAFGVAAWAAVRWQPGNVVKRRQAAFVEALEDRSGRQLQQVLAEDYLDQWGFDRDDAVVTLLDFGSQFLVLGVVPTGPVYEVGDDGKAVVRSGFELTGNGSPIAQEVIRRNNQLKAPFVFAWEKQSFWPGSWRLTRIENPDLPDDLYGYRPGDIGEAIRAGGF